MFTKKYLLAFVMSMLMIGFTSCEKDAPEINFSQTTTVKLDPEEIIDAINDLSTSLTDKLNMLQNALTEQNRTVAEKLDILDAAIKAQTLSLEGKLSLVETAIKNGVTSMENGQELIVSAIETLNGSMTEKLTAVQTAIKDQTLALDTKLTAIEAAIEQGVLDVTEEITATKTALVTSLTEHFTDTKESLDAVNKALTTLRVEEGIYEGSTREKLLMHPTTFELITEDEELHTKFLSVMTRSDIVTVSDQVVKNSGHMSGVPLEKSVKGENEILMARTSSERTESNPVEEVIRTYSYYVISARITDASSTYKLNSRIWQTIPGSGNYFSRYGSLNDETGVCEYAFSLADSAHRQYSWAGETFYFWVIDK